MWHKVYGVARYFNLDVLLVDNYLFFIVFDAILPPTRALDRRLQEDWARDAREGPRVLMSLRVDFGPIG